MTFESGTSKTDTWLWQQSVFLCYSTAIFKDKSYTAYNSMGKYKQYVPERTNQPTFLSYLITSYILHTGTNLFRGTEKTHKKRQWQRNRTGDQPNTTREHSQVFRPNTVLGSLTAFCTQKWLFAGRGDYTPQFPVRGLHYNNKTNAATLYASGTRRPGGLRHTSSPCDLCFLSRTKTEAGRDPPYTCCRSETPYNRGLPGKLTVVQPVRKLLWNFFKFHYRVHWIQQRPHTHTVFEINFNTITHMPTYSIWSHHFTFFQLTCTRGQNACYIPIRF
jgi:hypothetical protein